MGFAHRDNGRLAVTAECEGIEILGQTVIASDTPLYAALEIIAYGCLWLIARRDRPSRPSALLDADQVDLRVLAPAAYYSSYDLVDLASQLDVGLRALGKREGVELSFAFKRLDDRISASTIPDDQALLRLLDHSMRERV